MSIAATSSVSGLPGPPTSVVFAGRCFCFSGTMAGLKRSAAEREVRARGGQSSGSVNAQLDYLVVGDTPSRGWAHGSYGRKIESAMALRAASGRPMIVSEGAFMDALAAAESSNEGALDAQVVVVTAKLMIGDRSAIDLAAVEWWLAALAGEHGAHVTVAVHPLAALTTLFAQPADVAGSRGITEVVTCRIARQLSLTANAGAFVELVTAGFERVRGADVRITWFTRAEGTAGYVRLLREIPTSLLIPGL